jgi:hypothetical protein
MKKRKLRLAIIGLAICFVIAITFIAKYPIQQALVFQPNNSTVWPAYIPIKDKTHFQIKYTHSIHLTDVVESYQITADQKIHQYELMYEDFAIGMPSNAEAGETFEQINGKYYIKNMKQVLPFFHLRIGQVRANHRVIFNNKEFLLSLSIKPGTSVKVEIRKLTILEKWKGVNILDTF